MALHTFSSLSGAGPGHPDSQDAAFVLYFFSPGLAQGGVHQEIRAAYPDVPTVGCSMIGGWTTGAPVDTGYAGMVFSSKEVGSVIVARASGVKTDPDAAARSLVDQVKRRAPAGGYSPESWVGVLLVDGLALGERIVGAITSTSGLTVPIVGGAAADELTFDGTYVASGGEVDDDGAVLALLEMRVPFHYDHYVHYVPTHRPLMVTRADPGKRVVWEIDGEPASDRYAKMIGLTPGEPIEASVFGRNPFGVVLGDTVFARSPNAVVDGGGLQFYCSIEAGTRLELLKPGDIMGNAREAVAEARRLAGPLQGAVLFNCVLRHLEMKETAGAHDEFAAQFEGLQVAGVNTYGEELFTHHNQTLTALFIGASA
ncbi:MAG: FIST signal transduction protein [Spirochaetota bacterium]